MWLDLEGLERVAKDRARALQSVLCGNFVDDAREARTSGDLLQDSGDRACGLLRLRHLRISFFTG